MALVTTSRDVQAAFPYRWFTNRLLNTCAIHKNICIIRFNSINPKTLVLKYLKLSWCLFSWHVMIYTTLFFIVYVLTLWNVNRNYGFVLIVGKGLVGKHSWHGLLDVIFVIPYRYFNCIGKLHSLTMSLFNTAQLFERCMFDVLP